MNTAQVQFIWFKMHTAVGLLTGEYHTSGPWCWLQVNVWLWEVLDISGLHFPRIIKRRGWTNQSLRFLLSPLSMTCSSVVIKSAEGALFLPLINFDYYFNTFQKSRGWWRTLLKLKMDNPSHSWYQITNLIFKFEKNLEMISAIWIPWWSPTRELVYKG